MIEIVFYIGVIAIGLVGLLLGYAMYGKVYNLEREMRVRNASEDSILGQLKVIRRNIHRVERKIDDHVPTTKTAQRGKK